MSTVYMAPVSVILTVAADMVWRLRTGVHGVAKALSRMHSSQYQDRGLAEAAKGAHVKRRLWSMQPGGSNFRAHGWRRVALVTKKV